MFSQGKFFEQFKIEDKNNQDWRKSIHQTIREKDLGKSSTFRTTQSFLAMKSNSQFRIAEIEILLRQKTLPKLIGAG